MIVVSVGIRVIGAAGVANLVVHVAAGVFVIDISEVVIVPVVQVGE